MEGTKRKWLETNPASRPPVTSTGPPMPSTICPEPVEFEDRLKSPPAKRTRRQTTLQPPTNPEKPTTQKQHVTTETPPSDREPGFVHRPFGIQRPKSAHPTPNRVMPSVATPTASLRKRAHPDDPGGRSKIVDRPGEPMREDQNKDKTKKKARTMGQSDDNRHSLSDVASNGSVSVASSATPNRTQARVQARLLLILGGRAAEVYAAAEARRPLISISPHAPGSGSAAPETLSTPSSPQRAVLTFSGRAAGSYAALQCMKKSSHIHTPARLPHGSVFGTPVTTSTPSPVPDHSVSHAKSGPRPGHLLLPLFSPAELREVQHILGRDSDYVPSWNILEFELKRLGREIPAEIINHEQPVETDQEDVLATPHPLERISSAPPPVADRHLTNNEPSATIHALELPQELLDPLFCQQAANEDSAAPIDTTDISAEDSEDQYSPHESDEDEASSSAEPAIPQYSAPGDCLLHLFSPEELEAIQRKHHRDDSYVPSWDSLESELKHLGRQIPADIPRPSDRPGHSLIPLFSTEELKRIRMKYFKWIPSWNILAYELRLIGRDIPAEIINGSESPQGMLDPLLRPQAANKKSSVPIDTSDSTAEDSGDQYPAHQDEVSRSAELETPHHLEPVIAVPTPVTGPTPHRARRGDLLLQLFSPEELAAIQRKLKQCKAFVPTWSYLQLELKRRQREIPAEILNASERPGHLLVPLFSREELERVRRRHRQSYKEDEIPGWVPLELELVRLGRAIPDAIRQKAEIEYPAALINTASSTAKDTADEDLAHETNEDEASAPKHLSTAEDVEDEELARETDEHEVSAASPAESAPPRRHRASLNFSGRATRSNTALDRITESQRPHQPSPLPAATNTPSPAAAPNPSSVLGGVDTSGEPLLLLFSPEELRAIQLKYHKGKQWVPTSRILERELARLGRAIPANMIEGSAPLEGLQVPSVRQQAGREVSAAPTNTTAIATEDFEEEDEASASAKPVSDESSRQRSASHISAPIGNVGKRELELFRTETTAETIYTPDLPQDLVDPFLCQQAVNEDSTAPIDTTAIAAKDSEYEVSACKLDWDEASPSAGPMSEEPPPQRSASPMFEFTPQTSVGSFTQTPPAVSTYAGPSSYQMSHDPIEFTAATPQELQSALSALIASSTFIPQMQECTITLDASFPLPDAPLSIRGTECWPTCIAAMKVFINAQWDPSPRRRSSPVSRLRRFVGDYLVSVIEEVDKYRYRYQDTASRRLDGRVAWQQYYICHYSSAAATLRRNRGRSKSSETQNCEGSVRIGSWRNGEVEVRWRHLAVHRTAAEIEMISLN
jgi:hypothetical protein